MSSLHDRACELFYALVGGTGNFHRPENNRTLTCFIPVDYGEEHARSHGHKRFGRTHSSGLYPLWSQDNPLHFLGHSLVREVRHLPRHLADGKQGGPTVLKLQWLLQNGFFGAQYHPDMILSVNTSE